MALTPSNMIALGTQAPEFSLLDPQLNKQRSLASLKGRAGTLIMFLCNHCPFVKHIESSLIELGQTYSNSDITIIAINANDADNYPEDGPDKMALKPYPFPYLYDESQATAKAYNAACTPDFFLFDSELKCVYRGQFDDSRPSNSQPVSGADLIAAMNAVLGGSQVNPDQKPSIGCNIKWRES